MSAKLDIGKTTEPPARLRPLIVFVHIPKTAGTSFVRALSTAEPALNVGMIGNVFKGSGSAPQPHRIARIRESGVERTRKMDVVAGHLPFGVHAYFPPETRYVTFLRDPVERTLSHYYNATLNAGALEYLGRSLGEMLEEGLLHDNLQTRMLSDDPEPFGSVDETMLEQAKANLADRFLGFGLTERFDESLALFSRRLGLVAAGPVGQWRAADRTRGSGIPDSTRRLTEQYNRYDLELYAWAVKLFDEVAGEAPACALSGGGAR